MTVISMHYHRDGIGPNGEICSILIEEHPTHALNKAYALLRDIMPNNRWNISKINYLPSRVDTQSRMEVVASLKDWPLRMKEIKNA